MKKILKLKIVWIVVAMLAINSISLWSEVKLEKLAYRAIQHVDAGAFSDAEALMRKGDSIYRWASVTGYITWPRWDFDDFVNTSSAVKGRLALRDNKVAVAKTYLMESAMVKATPTLASFGPNMSLAKALLEAGESQVVIDYLEACRSFWEHDLGRIDMWIDQVNSGIIPDFGANLVY